mgnify:CR=1 FL=1
MTADNTSGVESTRKEVMNKRSSCIGIVFKVNNNPTTPKIPPHKGKPIEKWRHKANGSEYNDKDGRAAGVRKEEIG